MRCDCASMRLWRKVVRHLKATVPASSLHFYIYIDSSPEWRGLEVLATSIDIFDGQTYTRRLLPVVSLERCQLDLVGKAVSLLWQLWLVFGPSFANLKFVVDRVRAVCTDFGTESGIANMPDMLREFFWLLDPEFDRAPHDDFTFGRALQLPGWRHL